MQALQLISDGSIQAIKDLLQCAGKKKIAVAYWGTGATKEFGIKELHDAENVFVLCDLFSGSCNPKEIKTLLDRGCEIKTIDGLHSKVYCSSSRAIVGSSNASANGFAFNNSKFGKNIEANVDISDPSLVLEVNNWFDQYWKSALAKSVTPLMLNEIKPLWDRNSSGNRRQTSETLVELLDQRQLMPDNIKAKVIFYWGEQPSQKALKTFEDDGIGQYDEAQRRAFGDNTPFYEDHTGWPVNAGDVYLDFSTQASKPVSGGVWRVRDDFSVKIGKGPSRIILLDQELDLDGVRLSSSDNKLFCGAIAKFMKKNPKLWSATKANHYNIFEFDFAEFWRIIVLPARQNLRSK